MALDLASLANPEEYFFVFLGRFRSSWFNEKLRAKWNEFFASCNDNCFASFVSIEEGPSTMPFFLQLMFTSWFM